LSGFTPIALYAMQQIQQFRHAAGSFGMLHIDVETMDQVTKDLLADVLQGIPAEERMRRLSTEELLRGLSAEARIRGLSAQQVLAIISQEERARLRALLFGETKTE